MSSKSAKIPWLIRVFRVGILIAVGSIFWLSLNPIPQPSSSTTYAASPASDGQRRRPRRQSWNACLSQDVKKTESVPGDPKAHKTVESVLNALKARCSGQQLVDKKNREIRFVRAFCWGNPPADAEEQVAAQTAEIAELRKKFTVVLLRCAMLTE
jgi:hypothetical protein